MRRQLEKSLELEDTRGTRRPILLNVTRSLIPGVPATTVVSRIPGNRSMIMSRMSREAGRSDIKKRLENDVEHTLRSNWIRILLKLQCHVS